MHRSEFASADFAQPPPKAKEAHTGTIESTKRERLRSAINDTAYAFQRPNRFACRGRARKRGTGHRAAPGRSRWLAQTGSQAIDEGIYIAGRVTSESGTRSPAATIAIYALRQAEGARCLSAAFGLRSFSRRSRSFWLPDRRRPRPDRSAGRPASALTTRDRRHA